jgi:hypothetical protein
VDTQPVLSSKTQIITILHIGGRRFPVYWSHYVCWRAIIHSTERHARRILGTKEPTEGIWDLRQEDLLWAIMSSALIDEVKTKEGISSLQRVLTLDLGQRELELIQQADATAMSVHMSYVREKLGPIRSYFSTVSDKFEGPVSVMDPLDLIRIHVWITCLLVFFIILEGICTLVSRGLDHCVLLWRG